MCVCCCSGIYRNSSLWDLRLLRSGAKDSHRISIAQLGKLFPFLGITTLFVSGLSMKHELIAAVFFGDANLCPPTDGRLVTPGELKWGAIKNFGRLGVLPIFSNIQPVQRQSAFRNVIHLANNLNKPIPRCSWMTKDWIIYGRLGNRQEYKIAPSQPLKLAPAAPTPSSCCYTSPRNNSPTTQLPADHHLPSTLIRWLCILH